MISVAWIGKVAAAFSHEKPAGRTTVVHLHEATIEFQVPRNYHLFIKGNVRVQFLTDWLSISRRLKLQLLTGLDDWVRGRLHKFWDKHPTRIKLCHARRGKAGLEKWLQDSLSESFKTHAGLVIVEITLE